MIVERLDPHDRRVESIWRALEARAAPRYFLSWGWIENWLACLPADEAPPLLVFHDGGVPAAAAFVARRARVRHHVFASRSLFLNATGVPARDELCLEHNRVLADPAWSPPLASFVEALGNHWDEVALDALDAEAFPGRALAEPLPHHRVVVDLVGESPYVDLARVRAAGDYLALLAAGARAQLRRARRGFGRLDVEVAADLHQAFDVYDELVALHTASWNARGKPGAFADPWFERFHRRLTARRFPLGEVQLVRVRAGGRTIGCVYNLIAHGHVAFYQSGLARFDDPHLKAGYVCHAEAVRLCAAAGHLDYDFLATASQYKRSLATGARRLVWARIQRPHLRYTVEEWLRRTKRAVVAAAA